MTANLTWKSSKDREKGTKRSEGMTTVPEATVVSLFTFFN